MADYTSRYTGLQIDEALTSALNVKRVRGLIKMTDDGPVAAVPGEDFPDDGGSTVSVTGLLKGVLNEDINEIEVQQAEAGEDYQTPLKAGVDYATPAAVANKQNKITAQGFLVGDGLDVTALTAEQARQAIGAISADQKGVASGVATLDGEGKLTKGQGITRIAARSAGVTLTETLNCRCVFITSASAVTCTLQDAATFPNGFECEVVQGGAGAITFALASEACGNTICSLDGVKTTAGQYAAVTIKKMSDTQWLLAGALI